MHARVAFGDPAKLSFPVAVEDDPVDMAAARIGLPAKLLRGSEANVRSGACWVVGVKNGDDRPRGHERARDAGADALARHVGQHFVFQLRRVSAALADKAFLVEPLAYDSLQLPEEVELRLTVGVAVARKKEMRGKLVRYLRFTHLPGMHEGGSHRLADDAGRARFCSTALPG